MASHTPTSSNSNSGDEASSQTPSLVPMLLPTPTSPTDATIPLGQDTQPALEECLLDTRRRSRETSGKDKAEPEEEESSPKRIKVNDGGWSHVSRQLRDWAHEEGLGSINEAGESSTATPEYTLSSKVINQALTTLTRRCSRQEEQIKTLQNALAELDKTPGTHDQSSRIKELETDLSQLRRRCNSLERRLEEMDENYSNQQEQISMHEETITLLNQQLASMTAQLEAANALPIIYLVFIIIHFNLP